MTMTHPVTRSPARSRTTLDYDPKIVDSQRRPAPRIRRAAERELTDSLTNIRGELIMKRIALFAYGAISYGIFLITFLYAIGFVGDFIVPKSIDSSPQDPLGQSLLVDALLLGLFAVQHSVMARPAFKRWWTRFVPRPVERSTYVLFASLALIALFVFWQPIGGVIWNVQNP